MSNLLLFSKAIDDAALVVTSAATGYPKENMQDRRKVTSWKSTSTANQNIDMDFGSAFTADHLFLYHNLPTGTRVEPFYASQSNYSDEASAVDGFYATIGTGNTPPNLYMFFGPEAYYSARYWRIKLTNLPSVAEIYLVFLGMRLEITIRHDFGHVQEKKYKGHILKESFGGNRFSKRYYGGRKIFQYRWEFMDLTNQANLQSLIENIKGAALPFFMRTVNGTYEYVRLMNDEIGAAEVAHQLFNTDVLVLEEEF